MSGKGGSLTAVGADGYYLPPEYDPRKHGSIDKYQNSRGSLGDRTRKAHLGILIIRFEMPFNVWCLGCGHHIGKGVRFNAEKKQVGMYHSTKVWSFTFRTPCCQSRVEIRTDPANCDYAIMRGLRRKQETYSSKDAEVMELEQEEHRDRVRSDAFYRLEHQETAREMRKESDRHVAQLQKESKRLHEDEAALNGALRQRMREARHDELARRQRAGDLNMAVRLLPEHPEDREEARLRSEIGIGPGTGPGAADEARRAARRKIAAASIFSGGRGARHKALGATRAGAAKGGGKEVLRAQFKTRADGYDAVLGELGLRARRGGGGTETAREGGKGKAGAKAASKQALSTRAARLAVARLPLGTKLVRSDPKF
ncbi:unnamed protein product [Pedinophyceae sp. YPF-701]|nr:unnamed protein product [Pedinophyceae sp. YPF-701]